MTGDSKPVKPAMEQLASGIVVPGTVADELRDEQRTTVRWMSGDWVAVRKALKILKRHRVVTALVCADCKQIIQPAPDAAFTLRCTCRDRRVN